MTSDEFATAVRGLPLTSQQSDAANAAFATPTTSALPDDLVRRAVLTSYQAQQILAGDAAGLVVGRYVVLDELGGGGMGRVYKARDTVMDRVVALKLIRPDHLSSAAAVARFHVEVRAAARLAHPNIVRAYDAGTADGRHYLVSELVIGHDLGHELKRRGALPPSEACEYARQAAVGLQHAHEHGLTHRDIKPSNLLLDTRERVVKVADFGLARLGDADRLTADGAVFGTPDYIAPEQAASATRADIRSDLYSLGCTLYHLLTGRVPFPLDGVMAKLSAHASQEPEPLDDLCPALNPALVRVVRRLMAKDPNDRYHTPGDAAAALSSFCPKSKTAIDATSQPPADTPTSGPTLVAPSRSAEVPPAPVAIEGAPRAGRRVSFSVGCTVYLTLVLLVGVAAVTTMGTNANSTFSFVGSSIKPASGGGGPPVMSPPR